MTWTDARILHRTWADHFDPGAHPLEYAGSAAQEAWISVAATARLLSAAPIPLSLLTPGDLYIGAWEGRLAWADRDAPARCHVCVSLDSDTHFVLEPLKGELPLLTRIHHKPHDCRPVFGIVPLNITTPMTFSGVGNEKA